MKMMLKVVVVSLIALGGSVQANESVPKILNGVGQGADLSLIQKADLRGESIRSTTHSLAQGFCRSYGSASNRCVYVGGRIGHNRYEALFWDTSRGYHWSKF